MRYAQTSLRFVKGSLHWPPRLNLPWYTTESRLRHHHDHGSAMELIEQIGFLTLRSRLPSDVSTIREVSLGEVELTSDTGLYTVIGASVVVCLFDVGSGWAGMCHVMLPAQFGHHRDDAMLKADSTLETLNNRLRDAVEANGHVAVIKSKIFGGAEPPQVGLSFSDGRQSVIFTRTWLRSRNVPILAEWVGGEQRREVVLVPSGGQVFCKRVSMTSDFIELERSGLLTETAPLNKIELF